MSITYTDHTVKLANLQRDERTNARQTPYTDDEIASMAASITAQGVMMPLTARPNGKAGHYLVFAGGRRLAGMNKLAAEGHIDPAAFDVPIRVPDVDEAKAHELSTAENVERLDLDLCDEVEAFARLHAEGSTSEDIAIRFGLPERRVRQRIALGTLHPNLMEMLRDGRISVQEAQAFTIAPDHDRQHEVLEHFRERNYAPRAQEIRQLLTQDTIKSNCGLAEFVGEDAYAERGGTVTVDLFDDHFLWDDSGLAYQIAREKVADQMDALRADGWSWVRLEDEVSEEWSYRYRRLHGEAEPTDEAKTRMAEIEARMVEIEGPDRDRWDIPDEHADEYGALDDEMDELRDCGFTDEQKAMSGVVVQIQQYGVKFHEGIVNPADAREIAKAEKKDAPTGPKPYPAALCSDLRHALTGAVQSRVAAKPALAEAILLAKLVHITRMTGVYDHMGLLMSADSYRPVEAYNTTYAALSSQLDGIVEGIPTGTFTETVHHIGERMPAKDRKKLMALLVATSIDTAHGPEPFVTVAEPDVVKAWRPDEAFFARLNKAQLLEAITEACGEAEASKHTDKKKGDVVAAAGRLVPQTGWLPETLRTDAYQAPKAS